MSVELSRPTAVISSQTTQVLPSSGLTTSGRARELRDPAGPDPWLKRVLDIVLAASGLLVSLPAAV